MTADHTADTLDLDALRFIGEANRTSGHTAQLRPETVLALLDRLETAEAKVARVEAVHADAGDGWCLGCDADWPCATWDALRGESS